MLMGDQAGPGGSEGTARKPGADGSVSAVDPDWSRERPVRFWDPGPKLIRSIRRYQAARARGGPAARAASKYWVLVHRFWSAVTSCDIPLTLDAAGGLLLPHPLCIVIHPDARIGPNCLIFQGVTLAGPVTLGGHVDVGAGAKLLGPVTLGDDVRVGANAVVTRDVAKGRTVAGIPAREFPG